MTDTDRRLEQLETSLRRLRIVSATLAAGLIGVVGMAAAPSPGDRLTPSEIVIKSGDRTVTLSAAGLRVEGPNGVTALSDANVTVSRENLRSSMEITSHMAVVAVVVDEKAAPSSASLRVTNFKGQDPTPQLLVADPRNINSVLSRSLTTAK